MKFRCAGIQDNFLDGIGTGLSIYFQGCESACVGCHNPTLQDKFSGFDYDTNDILEHLNEYTDFYTSVIYLGGEPCLQPKPLYTLAANSKLPNILYTGFSYYEIPSYIKDVMYVIVAGPYVQELKTENFPSSANQEIYINNILTTNDFRKNYNVWEET